MYTQWTAPELNHAYVMGVDTAEGLAHGDYSVIQVLDVNTGEQVAIWHGHIAPDLLAEEIKNTPWRKISVWQYPLSNLNGDVLFLDLDIVITGNLDRFFSFKPGRYCVIENWTQLGMGVGNTSCFRFPIGKYHHLFKELEENPKNVLKKYHIEQVYLSMKIKEQVYWPKDWCKSFKHNLLPIWPIRIWKPATLPPNTSLVVFTGKPNPDDVVAGFWPVKKSQFSSCD